MRFAVFTHVIHHQQEGRFYAYSPYVREMNLWIKYAQKIEVVAPLEEGRIGEKEMREKGEFYEHPCITFTKIPSFHLLNLPAVLDSFIKIPVIFFRILGAMRRADHLHLRCPGNIGLLATIAQIFFPKKTKTVKYAGNWDPKAKQPWTYKLQKKILSNTFLSRNIKVLAYGDWPKQSANILPFFTASFSEVEKEGILKDFKPPYKFIFTGNLVEGKGVFKAIKLIEALNSKRVNSELEIYGDGLLKDDLNNFIQKKDLQKFVMLKGRKGLEELKEAYKKAHFVILLSKSEGWPKTIAEGMWYGCIPVATAVSCVPWMLGNGSRGIIFADAEKRKEKKEKREENKEEGGILLNDESQKNLFSIHPDSRRDTRTDGFSETDIKRIVSLLKNPVRLEEMSSAAQEWSQEYTLERFEMAIQNVLTP
ncbi:glycosyltransferase [Salegentibacter sp. JZCK2]|uniref:glycosyltransferase n=1 Tax=Salegentibacter tibetensis TaxID=2873600 RepID=UPI001CCED852|nr:glycosyltransferase [Salegentibacter tibetensis]MBZ9729763.1 glycosyltransferase [Salegentibacter tibetensis]